MATPVRPVGPFRRSGPELPAACATGATDRVDHWRDLIREHFVALDIATDRDPAFEGSVRSTLLGHLSVASVDSTRQECVRTPGLARHEGDSYLQFGLLAEGEAVLQQDDREALLGPGGYALYETDRPFVWHFRGPWRLLVFTWPRDLVGLGRDASRASTARTLGGDGLGAMVGRLLTDVVSAPPPLTAVGGARLADELGELVGTVAGEVLRRDEVLSPRGAAELRRRVDAYVAEHLEDPALGPEGIARAHFVSTRQLHRAFAEDAETVSGLVRRRRLEHGRRELLDPRLADLTVTDISLRCGFTDLAAFSRAFRASYHEAPSSYRRRGGV
jgi:AraC family transcriptional regulator, positive regulator of tynA and feaB